MVLILFIYFNPWSQRHQCLQLLAPKTLTVSNRHFHFYFLDERRLKIEMEEEVRKRLEYEEQYFGMSSLFFADCFKKLILDELESKITRLVENFKGKLLEQAKNKENFELSLQKMKEDLTALYKSSVEKVFPEVESKISNFIHIPSNILLKEDLPMRAGLNGDLKEIGEEIKNLKGNFLSLLYMKQKLLEELEEADSAIFFMEYIMTGKKLDFNMLPVEEISALSKANNCLINES